MPPRGKAIAIIQARMSSSRLPGKVLKKMGGRPMLQLLVDRVTSSLDIPVVVATSMSASDRPIEQLCQQIGVPVVCGPLDDVLGRFLKVIEAYSPDLVVRLTGDNPVVDSFAIQRSLEAFGQKAGDTAPDEQAGVSNHLSQRVDPYGYAVEVVRAESLQWLNEQDLTPDEREHVTLGLVRRGLIRPFHIFDPDLSAIRWTIDYPEDFDYISALFTELGADVTVQEAISWSKRHTHPRSQ